MRVAIGTTPGRHALEQRVGQALGMVGRQQQHIAASRTSSFFALAERRPGELDLGGKAELVHRRCRRGSVGPVPGDDQPRVDARARAARVPSTRFEQRPWSFTRRPI